MNHSRVISEVKGITHGIPQGSFLGYLNDFSLESDILISMLFEDDTIVLIECYSYNNIITILNN